MILCRVRLVEKVLGKYIISIDDEKRKLWC